MKNTKKTTGLALIASIAILSFVPFLGVKEVLAAPTIKEVRGRESTELKLPIKYTKYASKKVRIKLYTTNLITGEERVTKHNRKLNSDGRVTLKVDNLNPGTPYKFKVKIRKQSGGSYSSKSDSREGSTRFAGLD